MGRRIEVTFVTADGMECRELVELGTNGQLLTWLERAIRNALPVTLAPVGEYPRGERLYTRRYELHPYRERDGRDSWRYVEVNPQAYSKEIADLRQRNAELEVEAGLLRRQVMGLGVVPTSTPCGG